MVEMIYFPSSENIFWYDLSLPTAKIGFHLFLKGRSVLEIDFPLQKAGVKK